MKLKKDATMLKSIKIIILSAATCSLSACIYNEGSFDSYQPYRVEKPVNMPPQTYQNYDEYNYQSQGMERVEPKKQVVVPETYHMSQYQSPQSHKDRDRRWVETQNPQGYTIEVADSDKAHEVAGKLYKAPKSQRMAQVKYHQNGNQQYKGVYGSYSSYEEAQKALTNLPEDVKANAKIRTWSNVQSSVGNE